MIPSPTMTCHSVPLTCVRMNLSHGHIGRIVIRSSSSFRTSRRRNETSRSAARRLKLSITMASGSCRLCTCTRICRARLVLGTSFVVRSLDGCVVAQPPTKHMRNRMTRSFMLTLSFAHPIADILLYQETAHLSTHHLPFFANL